MTGYLVRRLVSLVPVLLIVTFLAFLLASLSPGDPAIVVARQRNTEQPSAQEIADIRAELRLDDPFAVRYLHWVTGVVRGDLGTSFQGDRVLPALTTRMGATMQLAIPAFLLSTLIALAMGTISAVRRGSLVDHLSRVAALVGSAMPSFALAYLLIIIFSVKLHLLPVAGRESWKNLVLPVLTLGLGSGASLGRLVRSSLLDTLGDDYVRTARAKGLGERAVVVFHALRNSLVPILTVLGLRFGRLLAGAAIVETVFTWPGVGRYVVESIFNQDYPVIQGFVILTGTGFVVVNLVIDLLYARMDPRVLVGRTSE